MLGTSAITHSQFDLCLRSSFLVPFSLTTTTSHYDSWTPSTSPCFYLANSRTRTIRRHPQFLLFTNPVAPFRLAKSRPADANDNSLLFQDPFLGSFLSSTLIPIADTPLPKRRRVSIVFSHMMLPPDFS
jgi:hypothetical protein